MSVNLRKIKVAFFDYDDTLCVHRHISVNRPEKSTWDKAILLDVADWYSHPEYCVPQPAIQEFVTKLKGHGVKCHCLTWSNTNQLERARRKFLDENYNEAFDKIYIVGSREYKIDILENYVGLLHFKRDEILLVEDHPDTIYEARSKGFNALTVSEIVVEWCEYLKLRSKSKWVSML